MDIVVQYFDGCPHWHLALDHLRRAIDQSGRTDVHLVRQAIKSPGEAARHRFRGSPSIIVNGIDPFAEPSVLVGLTCRIYQTPAGPSGAPTVEQLLALLE